MNDRNLVKEGALTGQTLLVGAMHANNEVDTIQPIRELARMAHQYGVLFHMDATRSLGKIPVSVKDPDVDFLTMAGQPPGKNLMGSYTLLFSLFPQQPLWRMPLHDGNSTFARSSMKWRRCVRSPICHSGSFSSTCWTAYTHRA